MDKQALEIFYHVHSGAWLEQITPMALYSLLVFNALAIIVTLSAWGVTPMAVIRTIIDCLKGRE